ncbi:hypothetical protein BJ912DRAFT_1142225 [Pholiota molesta]|nr:hypothetical protein BJ912DRAFT_1142225 [Pholiota molesta]
MHKKRCLASNKIQRFPWFVGKPGPFHTIRTHVLRPIYCRSLGTCVHETVTTAAMSESDEDVKYQVERDELDSIFDNIFRTFTGEPAQLSRNIFSVIQAHPTMACAHALAHALTSHSEENPKEIYRLVQGTAAVFTSYPESSEIIIDEPEMTCGGPAPFHAELYVELAEYMSYGMEDNQRDLGQKYAHRM